jgi:hypothetical protein
MDPLTIILATIALAAFAGLAYMAGYELGTSAAISTEREAADRRVRGVLDSVNKAKPRTTRKRRASK